MSSNTIMLLPEIVANQIAAGEVVQRPASVVKELVENAVDAGATKVQVVVADGGRTLIQVIDNGKGMSETDARLAFERHATSKIACADDLFALTTMGFRGEALAAIASVSDMVSLQWLHMPASSVSRLRNSSGDTILSSATARYLSTSVSGKASTVHASWL